MKKMICICAAALLLAGCQTAMNEPKATESVKFLVTAFGMETRPMRAPAETILDDDEGTALTDLYVFDGTQQLVHQTNDAADFGTVTLDLAHGIHNLSFILTRSTGITVEDGVMSMSSVRSTFGKLLALNVTASTGAQDLTLDRISGQLIVTINDAFPAAANEIEFVINPRYMQLDVTNLHGVNGASYTTRVSCSSKVGLTGQSYTFNHIAPSIDGESNADVTINVYDAGGSVISSVTIDDVRLASNTKTLLSGNLFAAPRATINVSHTWNTAIVGTW